jgi:hypothetical protein
MKNARGSRRTNTDRGQGVTPLAEDDQLLPLDGWPSEGRTLGEILRPLYGPAVWSKLTEHTGELLPPHLNDRGKWAIIPGNRSGTEATNSPFVNLWNSGQLIAKGRRGDLFADAVEIPPPSIGYDIWVANFTRSVIRDPTYPEKMIFDLRFFARDAESKSENATKRNSTVGWVTAEAQRMKATGEINESTSITDFAKQLADRMSAAPDATGESIKPVGWRHIKNMLPAWGLWPVTSIKK